MTKTRGGGGTSRRFILTGAAGLLAAAAPARAADQSTAAPSPNGAEPFFGTSQAGIATPAQSHTFFTLRSICTPTMWATSPVCCKHGPTPPRG